MSPENFSVVVHGFAAHIENFQTVHTLRHFAVPSASEKRKKNISAKNWKTQSDRVFALPETVSFLVAGSWFSLPFVPTYRPILSRIQYSSFCRSIYICECTSAPNKTRVRLCWEATITSLSPNLTMNNPWNTVAGKSRITPTQKQMIYLGQNGPNYGDKQFGWNATFTHATIRKILEVIQTQGFHLKVWDIAKAFFFLPATNRWETMTKGQSKRNISSRSLLFQQGHFLTYFWSVSWTLLVCWTDFVTSFLEW